MAECWSGNPAARLTSLRVKKTLSKLEEILEATEKIAKLQSIQPWRVTRNWWHKLLMSDDENKWQDMKIIWTLCVKRE